MQQMEQMLLQITVTGSNKLPWTRAMCGATFLWKCAKQPPPPEFGCSAIAYNWQLRAYN